MGTVGWKLLLRKHMAVFVLFALLATVSVNAASKENSAIHTEIEVLADNLNDLLKKIESVGEGSVADEDIFHEIVEKIQDLAEATEEENLIKLAETVKNKRMKEEQLQSSLLNLETLSEQLEKITGSTDNDKDSKMAEIVEIVTLANLDDKENTFITTDLEQDQDVDMNKKLDVIKSDVEQFIKFVK